MFIFQFKGASFSIVLKVRPKRHGTSLDPVAPGGRRPVPHSLRLVEQTPPDPLAGCVGIIVGPADGGALVGADCLEQAVLARCLFPQPEIQ